MIIKEVRARKIKDSRGENTIEVLINGVKASSPSGKSRGKFETKPYRNSLEWNLGFLNNFKKLRGLEIDKFSDLERVEKLIKKKINGNVKGFGANALFALESAVLKALAKSKRKELWQVINAGARKMPVPVGNVIGGGLHSSNKNKPEFQEFLIIPKKSIGENVKTMKEIHKKLKSVLKAKDKNDEGAWQTSLSNEEILEVLYKFRDKVRIGLDIAASSFYKNGMYKYKDKKLKRNEQIDYLNYLIKKYDLFYVEDGLQEEDFLGFSKIKKRHLIVGDDLTVTHIDRLKRAIARRAINAMIIKPNQNGSLLELKRIFEMCKGKGIKTIISHRSGETLDDSLADYAFGFGAGFIKCGVATKWRDVKLKRLIKIGKKF